MKDRYPSETQDRVMVRLPDGMHRDIKDAGKAANRNMTQEIVARLRWTFKNDEAFRADITISPEKSDSAPFAWTKKTRQDNFAKLLQTFEDRLGEAEKRLDVAEDALVPDFTLGQRIEALEVRVDTLEKAKRR